MACTLRSLYRSFLVIATLLVARGSEAAPITSGTGPGGIGALGVANQGPVLWLDANNISGATPGLKVNTWNDLSTLGNNATAHAGSLNTYQVGVRNGNPVVRLPGAVNQREFSVPNLAGRTFVAALLTNGNFNCCDGLFGELGSDNGLRQFNNGSPAYQVTGPIGGGGVDVNGTGAASFGAFNTWHTVQALTTGALAGHTNFGIGQYFSTGDREIQGDLGEIAVYSQTLNSAQRQILHSYYGAKYDFAVTNDRYAGDTGGNGNYDHAVFGVGRVDASNVYVDADGLGPNSGTGSAGLGIEVDALDLADGEFFLAGHNGNTSPTFITDGNGFNRMGRVWYFDTTETDGFDATISFDLSDIGVTLPSLADGEGYFLMYADSSALNFNQLLNANLVGDTFTFNLSDALLLDGYFTIAVAQVPEPSTALLLTMGAAGLLVQMRRRRHSSAC